MAIAQRLRGLHREQLAFLFGQRLLLAPFKDRRDLGSARQPVTGAPCLKRRRGAWPGQKLRVEGFDQGQKLKARQEAVVPAGRCHRGGGA